MKLPQAPLKEVIFEIIWETEVENGLFMDKGFDFAVGVFASKIKSSFPSEKKILPDNVGSQFVGRAKFQFWKGEAVWPVVQIGPGIMAINDTEQNYDWENGYYSLLKECLDLLWESYNNRIKVKRITLKYVDAVDVDAGINFYAFLKENLQTEVKNNFPAPGRTVNFGMNQAFLLERESIADLGISSGINNITNQNAMVWTTEIHRNGTISLEDIKSWLEFAHSNASSIFKNMISEEFYQTFQ